MDITLKMEFLPDIKVDITDEDKLNHIDTIIETAIDQF